MGAAQYNASESSGWVWIWMGGFESPLSGSWESRVNLFLWMHTDHLWITYNSNFKTAHWKFVRGNYDKIKGPRCGWWGCFFFFFFFCFQRCGGWGENSRKYLGQWIYDIKNTNGILVQLAQHNSFESSGNNVFESLDCWLGPINHCIFFSLFCVMHASISLCDCSILQFSYQQENYKAS